VYARRPAAPRIGWLVAQRRGDQQGWLTAFRTCLAAQGHAEGWQYQLDERDAGGDAARLGPLAEALVQGGARRSVATSQPAVDAAARATRSVPVIGRMTDDPVQTGLACSLARPGGNVTGVYSLLEEMAAKCVALLREALPSIRKVGALLTLDPGATSRWLTEARRSATLVDRATCHGRPQRGGTRCRLRRGGRARRGAGWHRHAPAASRYAGGALSVGEHL
jgi:putative ABC transport system substrate-binding protein